MLRLLLACLVLIVSAPVAFAAERVLLFPQNLGDTAGARSAAASPLRALRAAAEKDGSVKVIVGLRVPFAAEGRLGRAASRAQRADIASAATAIRGRFARAISRAPNAFRKFDTVPFMALEVTAEELDRLAADPLVIGITENRTVGPFLAKSLPQVQGGEAHDAGFMGTGQAIAIIDTGVDKNHPFLGGRIISEACYSVLGQCPGGETQSIAPGSGMPCSGFGCGHGTHVAGIAAGSGSTSSGVAPGASIIAIQVFSRTSFGLRASFSDIIAGLERVYALRNDFPIAAVNMSLGGDPYTFACDSLEPGVTAAISNLRSAGIAPVVSSGNHGDTRGIAIPACISQAVSVGSVSTSDWGPCFDDLLPTARDKVACYSNSASFLSLLAPGSPIRSSIPNNGYDEDHGTSMAAPHVAGAWAVLKQAAPTASVDQILSALQATGTNVVDYRNGISKKRINVKAALDHLTPALSYARAGSGSGTVAFSPQGSLASCTASCANRYLSGTAVTLTATPDAGSVFDGWSGACSGTGSCAITMNEARSVTATFTRESHPLTISKTGNGQVSCNGGSCAASYASGTSVTLTATPDAGWQFASWTGCASTSGSSCTVTMSAARSVGVTFTQQSHPLTISKTGNGQVSCNGGSCAASYLSGTSVTLTATPDAGWQFASWTGCASTSGSSCTVTMSAARSVGVTFTVIQESHPLTISKTGNGEVSCNGGSCAASYASGTSVTLTATPDAGWQFAGWSGACSGTGSCVITMSEARSVTATFNEATGPVLSYTRSGDGLGTVTFRPAADLEQCSGSCSLSFSPGTRVRLTATPAPGARFAGWSGACSGTGSCRVRMTEAKSVTATFTAVPVRAVRLLVDGGGSGSVAFSPSGTQASCSASCTSSFTEGARVRLTATPAPGARFAGWSGPCRGTGTCRLSMSETRFVTATFTTVPVHALSLAMAGDGSGSVGFSPAGTQASCSAACTSSFTEGTRVRLTATPAAGARFAGWTGACGGSRSCTVSMSEARSVTATFTAIPVHELSLTMAGSGSGSVGFSPAGTEASCSASCTSSFTEGTSVRLTATPAPGQRFAGWTGACRGTGTCRVNMNEARSVTATFSAPETASRSAGLQ